MYTAIYTRVSTEEQAHEGFSINAQKEKLTKYAELNEWIITDYYVDDGISGKNLKDRPEVTRLITDVKSGKINNVLVYKLDRITRSVKDLIYLIELFDKYDCTFNSETEKIDTSNAVGRMFVKIIGIFAEFERENLAERVSLGYEQKAREGNYINTRGVFGYDYIVGEGILEINELESMYVKKIYEWYLEGNSMRSIAIKLMDKNVPTKRGGKWNQATIQSILTNPLYIGRVRYGIRKSNSFETEGKNFSPIIDESLFNSVQELLNNRKKFLSRKYSSDNTYYFKVLKCSKCGEKYHARQQIQNGKIFINYSCNGNYYKTCDMPGFSHPKLELAFLNYLDNIETFEFDENILYNVSNDNEIEKNRIINEIDKLNKKRNDTVNLYTEDKVDLDTFQEIQSILNKKIERLNNELNNITEEKPKEIIDVRIIKEIITNIKENFMYLDNHEKRLFIERFIKTIKVRKDGDNVVIDEVVF